MSKRIFICSTLPHDVNIGGVILKGGAGVYTMGGYDGRLNAPTAVWSVVTDSQLSILEKNEFYQDWVKAGFLKKVKKQSDSLPKDMNKKSGGSMEVLEAKTV